MTRRKYVLQGLLFSTALFSAQAVAAQEAPPPTVPTAPLPEQAPEDPAAQAAQEASSGSDIVVTGQRASDRASLQKKRSAANTTEVVSSDDVGKLPDQNVAESVRRLTGVSVATDKGEGRYVIIRGIEPDLANVTVNNQTASAPEPESRNVKLDDIPSALIGTVTVVKTLTPDLDANAIAGQVDISTVNAFDKRRTFATAKGVLGLYEDTGDNAKEGDIGVGTLFGAEKQFGVVAAINYSKRPSYSEDVLSTSRQEVNGIDLPAEMDQRVYDPAFRTRKGGVLNLDWRPSDSARFYVRSMYSEFNDEEFRQRFRFFFPGSLAGYSNLDADGGTIRTTTARRLLRQRQETTKTATASLGTRLAVGEGDLTIEGTYSKSKKDDPLRNEVEFRASASTGLGADFDLGDRLMDSFTVNAAGLNPANFRLNNYKQVSRKARENLYQARIDYQLPLDALGDDGYLKLGGKYLDRHRTQDQTGRTLRATGAATSRTIADAQLDTVNTIFDGDYTFGPLIDMNAIEDYIFGNQALFTVDPVDQVSQSKTNDYKVNEKVVAGYVMASIRTGDLTVIPGVRVEHTDGDTAAVVFEPGVTTLNTPYNSFGSYSYTDWFPGVNARYDVNKHLILRGAITTAIGRPPFVDLAPTVVIDTGTPEVTLGNPNLKPQKALNFDAAVEYYFAGEGGASVAFFHKRIKNPIFETTATDQDGVFGGVELEDAIVNSFGNGDEAKVTGLEFAVQKPFTFLPSPLDGFGINANLTFAHSDLKVPGRSVHTPMVGQAAQIASVQLYYEKYGISGRLAYSYHSSYLDTDGGLDVSDPSGEGDGYFGKLSTLDARLGYKFNKYVEVFAEGTNLTDAQDYYYFRRADRFREGEKYGRALRLGLNLNY